MTLSGVVAGDTVTSSASILGATNSTSGHLKAGSYAQSADTLFGADAGNYTLIEPAGQTVSGKNGTDRYNRYA